MAETSALLLDAPSPSEIVDVLKESGLTIHGMYFYSQSGETLIQVWPVGNAKDTRSGYLLARGMTGSECGVSYSAQVTRVTVPAGTEPGPLMGPLLDRYGGYFRDGPEAPWVFLRGSGDTPVPSDGERFRTVVRQATLGVAAALAANGYDGDGADLAADLETLLRRRCLHAQSAGPDAQPSAMGFGD